MLAQWDLQILLVPGILLVLLFSYVPMYGVVMGFQDFQLGDFPGFSQWDRLQTLPDHVRR